MERPDIHIFEQIHSLYYQLTAAERKVADYVLSTGSDIQFMSITQLADACGVAEATISRFCRSLQLQGFNAFKIELAKQSVPLSESIRFSKQDADSSTFAGRCQTACQLAQEAASQTMALAEQKTIEQAVALFENADHIVCIGNGGSMIMATECAHLFSTVSPKFHAQPDSHLQSSCVSIMDPKDVVLLFSYSGATRSGIEVLNLAKTRGVKTVLVTRYPKSPAASIADVVLCCGSNEGPFQLGSVPARVAQLVLIDILFREYYHRNKTSCDECIERIASALSEKHI